MSKPKDCSTNNGDRKVIISFYTAVTALNAITKLADDGEYKFIMADQVGTIQTAFEELNKATEI